MPRGVNTLSVRNCASETPAAASRACPSSAKPGYCDRQTHNAQTHNAQSATERRSQYARRHKHNREQRSAQTSADMFVTNEHKSARRPVKPVSVATEASIGALARNSKMAV